MNDPKCTGCVLCYAECPYDAIRMLARSDDSGYQKLAVINAAQCTACGICAGACPTEAISLMGDYSSEQIFGAVKGALHRETGERHPLTVVFASQRARVLGGLPPRLHAGDEKTLVNVTSWNGEAGGRVVTAVLPSVGAVNIEWIKYLLQQGARDVVIVSHPYDDSLNREDAHWILNRLHLRPALVMPGLHWLDATPSDSSAVQKFLFVVRAARLSVYRHRLRNPTDRFSGLRILPC